MSSMLDLPTELIVDILTYLIQVDPLTAIRAQATYKLFQQCIPQTLHLACTAHPGFFDPEKPTLNNLLIPGFSVLFDTTPLARKVSDQNDPAAGCMSIHPFRTLPWATDLRTRSAIHHSKGTWRSLPISGTVPITRLEVLGAYTVYGGCSTTYEICEPIPTELTMGQFYDFLLSPSHQAKNDEVTWTLYVGKQLRERHAWLGGNALDEVYLNGGCLDFVEDSVDTAVLFTSQHMGCCDEVTWDLLQADLGEGAVAGVEAPKSPPAWLPEPLERPLTVVEEVKGTPYQDGPDL